MISCPGHSDIEEPFALRLLFLPVLVLEYPEDGRLLTLVVVCRVRDRVPEHQPFLHHDGRAVGPRGLRKVRDDDNRKLQPLCSMDGHDQDRIGGRKIQESIPLPLLVIDASPEFCHEIIERGGTASPRDGDQFDVRCGLLTLDHPAEDDTKMPEDSTIRRRRRLAEPAGERDPVPRPPQP